MIGVVHMWHEVVRLSIYITVLVS